MKRTTLGPFFLLLLVLWVMEEGELLLDEWEGSQPVTVAVWSSSLSFGILLGFIGCLLLLLV